jgi:hypothetical protein
MAIAISTGRNRDCQYALQHLLAESAILPDRDPYRDIYVIIRKLTSIYSFCQSGRTYLCKSNLEQEHELLEQIIYRHETVKRFVTRKTFETRDQFYLGYSV